ncbi:uncharacterized protein BXZ73DRAFT_105425 [Epithele typhae]|uniref:uncharacterized protein n=1 Tax=Epithele typhae TaxID=378194 RepID=UPI0020082E31|nr:uncharacterized protein BXZ73DRAFT_105425 [Epithele typhae]KAH9917905.1 hypothetical protein BXZ73DRAFT_105425 [Epithele typhae]
MHFTPSSLLAAAVLLATGAHAGPVAPYGVCQTGECPASSCVLVAVACYSAAGFTFGTVKADDPHVPAAVLNCNAALGTCQAACAKVTLPAATPH